MATYVLATNALDKAIKHLSWLIAFVRKRGAIFSRFWPAVRSLSLIYANSLVYLVLAGVAGFRGHGVLQLIAWMFLGGWTLVPIVVIWRACARYLVANERVKARQLKRSLDGLLKFASLLDEGHAKSVLTNAINGREPTVEMLASPTALVMREISSVLVAIYYHPLKTAEESDRALRLFRRYSTHVRRFALNWAIAFWVGVSGPFLSY